MSDGGDRNEMDISGVPQGRGIQIMECPDPHCGPHIVVLDANDKPICHVAIPQRHLLSVIKVMQGILYSKIVETGDE